MTNVPQSVDDGAVAAMIRGAVTNACDEAVNEPNVAAHCSHRLHLAGAFRVRATAIVAVDIMKSDW